MNDFETPGSRTSAQKRLAGSIARGGPRFLVVFGSSLLLIWGLVALAASATVASLGGSGGAAFLIALILWIAAIVAMYAAFSEWDQGQRVGAGVSALSFIIALILAPGWIFFWAFSGGLIGLAAFLSWRSSQRGTIGAVRVAAQPSRPGPGQVARPSKPSDEGHTEPSE